jgi:hypothetical protein
MLAGDGAAGRKIRNGASDTQRAVMRARRELEPGERMPQELIAVAVGRAMTVYLTRAEEGIGFVPARKLPLMRRGAVGRGLPRTLTVSARFEFGDAPLEVGEFRLRALEKLSLNLEILPQHYVEPIEPCREQRPQVALNVQRRRIAQRLADPLAQLLGQPFVDHVGKVSPRAHHIRAKRRSPRTLLVRSSKE